MGISDYAMTNMRYSKQNPKIMLSHTSGLPVGRLMALHYISYDNDFLKIDEIKAKIFEPSEVVRTYKISIGKILAIEVLTHQKITRYGNGVVDGDIPIKEAFSTIASSLAAIEEKNPLAKSLIVLTISYYDKEDNIKNITFEANQDEDVCNMFVRDFNNKFNRKGMQEDKSNVNEKGEYML